MNNFIATICLSWACLSKPTPDCISTLEVLDKPFAIVFHCLFYFMLSRYLFVYSFKDFFFK